MLSETIIYLNKKVGVNIYVMSASYIIQWYNRYSQSTIISLVHFENKIRINKSEHVLLHQFAKPWNATSPLVHFTNEFRNNQSDASVFRHPLVYVLQS